MLVLWIMVLLMALATEFAFSMRTEVNTTKNYKEDVESYFLAKAGVNLAMAELFQNARFHSIHEDHGFIVGKPHESQIETAEDFQALEEELPFEIVERIGIPLGNGTIHYRITDENGKVNLNKASRETLIKVLSASGFEVGEERDIIADSILDWIDKDDTHRLNGAENDYYQNLSSPYSAKDDFFDSVDELLKVRGITEEILYGTPENAIDEDSGQIHLGLNKFFTVQDVMIFNPNTADPAVLPIYFAEVQVEEILAARAEKGFFNDTLSTHFTIESTGSINDSRTKHTIIAIIQKFGIADNATLLVRYWNDNAVES